MGEAALEDLAARTTEGAIDVQRRDAVHHGPRGLCGERHGSLHLAGLVELGDQRQERLPCGPARPAGADGTREGSWTAADRAEHQAEALRMGDRVLDVGAAGRTEARSGASSGLGDRVLGGIGE